MEVSWEVCNQVWRHLYRDRSKAPSMVEHAHSGVLYDRSLPVVKTFRRVEPLDDREDLFGQAAANLRKKRVLRSLC